MTLREQAAKTAMGALIGRSDTQAGLAGAPEYVAQLAVQYADELVAKLGEGENRDTARLNFLIECMNHDGMTVEELFEQAYDTASETADPDDLQAAMRATIDRLMAQPLDLRMTDDDPATALANETRNCRNCANADVEMGRFPVCRYFDAVVREVMSCPHWEARQ